ncbi:MAG: hypothetical protein M3N12_08395 [Verrucomicrobiota bacterium]|nr:hypothetical protein [Verrucomicrobiota bacterium]
MSRIRAAAAVVALVGTLMNLSGAPEKKVIDLAAIVTKADAAAALGEQVQDPQLRNEEGAEGYYSRCNYYSQNPGRSLVLRLRQASTGQLAPVQQLEELMAGNAKMKPLVGFGDKAAVASEGAPSGLSHLLMLYVAKGNALITVGIGGIDDEKTGLEKAKTLARKIMKKL